jgi:PAS domain S-box-containing protein
MKRPSDYHRRSKSPSKHTEQLMVASREEIPAMPARKVRALVHELHVQQIELELQNEELRQAQLALAESRDRYSDLYEFAPIGYVTLDRQRRIIESNLTASSLLGMERIHLIGTDISRFVAREFRDNCYLYFQAVFESRTKQTCELRMCTKNDVPLIVRLESIAGQFATGGVHCRTALIDVTEARIAQEQLQKFDEELEPRVSLATAALQQRNEQLAEQSAELARSERHFRMLINNVPALFSYVDLDQRYQYVNHEYVKAWRRRPLKSWAERSPISSAQGTSMQSGITLKRRYVAQKQFTRSKSSKPMVGGPCRSTLSPTVTKGTVYAAFSLSQPISRSGKRRNRDSRNAKSASALF